MNKRLFVAFLLAALCSGNSLLAQHESAEKMSDSNDSNSHPQIFKHIDQMPVFNGDVRAFLSKAVVYPDSAKENSNTGRSIVQFVINVDGRVTDVKIVRSSGYQELDAEAVRVVASMPDWKPGRQSGKPIKVMFVLPITFSL